MPRFFGTVFATAPLLLGVCLTRVDGVRLGSVDEHPFTYCTIGHCHDPVLSTTILSHDSIDDTYMGVTLGVDNATILTSTHSR